MDEVQSESTTKSESEQALRKFVRKRMKIGGVMALALLVLPVMIYLAQYSVLSFTLLILMMLLIVIGFTGFIVLVYYVKGGSILFHSLDILRQISPPEAFIEGKFAVLNKDPVYAIAQWGSNILMFVAFHQAERSFDQKVKVPKLIWTWEYKHQIGKVKVAIREDEFSIPTTPGTYYKGKGILYSLLLEESVLVSYRRSFNTDQLNEIVDHLANAISSSGSSHGLFDEDIF